MPIAKEGCKLPMSPGTGFNHCRRPRGVAVLIVTRRRTRAAKKHPSSIGHMPMVVGDHPGQNSRVADRHHRCADRSAPAQALGSSVRRPGQYARRGSVALTPQEHRRGGPRRWRCQKGPSTPSWRALLALVNLGGAESFQQDMVADRLRPRSGALRQSPAHDVAARRTQVTCRCFWLQERRERKGVLCDGSRITSIEKVVLWHLSHRMPEGLRTFTLGTLDKSYLGSSGFLLPEKREISSEKTVDN